MFIIKLLKSLIKKKDRHFIDPCLFELFERYLNKKCKQPPIDGMRICEVHIRFFRDGSGSVVHEWCSAAGTAEERIIHTIFMEVTETDICFDNIDELVRILKGELSLEKGEI